MTKILIQLIFFLFYFVSITEHICSTKNKEVIFMSEKKELNLDNTDQAAGGWDLEHLSLEPYESLESIGIDDKAFSIPSSIPSSIPYSRPHEVESLTVPNIPNPLELHKIPKLEKLKHFTNPPKNSDPSEQ